MTEELCGLEGSSNTPACDGVGFHRGNFFVSENNFAIVGLYRTGYQVKQCRFTSAVGANDTFNRTLMDIYTDIIDGVKTAEKPMQTLCLEKRVTH
jgi:hypothetical protein